MDSSIPESHILTYKSLLPSTHTNDEIYSIDTNPKNLTSLAHNHFNNPQFSDLTLTIGPNKSLTLHLHKVIIHQHSSYFRNLLSDNKKSLESNPQEIFLQESHPESVYIIIYYIYTGIILHCITPEYIISLHKESITLNIPEIISHISTIIPEIIHSYDSKKLLLNLLSFLRYFTELTYEKDSTGRLILSNILHSIVLLDVSKHREVFLNSELLDFVKREYLYHPIKWGKFSVSLYDEIIRLRRIAERNGLV